MVEVERILPVPILDLIRHRIRTGPRNANRVYRFRGTQIDHHPLWMQRVTFAGEAAGQIGIALPICEIRAGYRSVSAGREAAVWKCVGQDVAGRLFEVGAAGKISAAVGGVAPGSILGPVPCGHAEFGVVAIGNRSPAGRKRFLNDVRGVNFVDAGA